MGQPSAEAERPGLSRAQELLLAVACGLAVANVYFAQPLLDAIAAEFHVGLAAVGLVPTVTQLGYAAGLVLVVPLGDRLNRRSLIVGMSALSSAALAALACSPTTSALIATSFAVGALAVVTQVMVAHVAVTAAPERQGRAVGAVTSGIIVGILGARTASGAMADLWGWRSVYFAAAAVLVVALLLRRQLPSDNAPGERRPYPLLVASTFDLLRSDRALRRKAPLAFWIFASASALSTAMVLPLTSAPFSLTHTEVGLFGLAGVAGALGAARAGSWSDHGHERLVTGVGLALMLLAWGAAAMLGLSLWWLAAAIVVLDFGLQSTHVANQSAIYRAAPASHSRITAAYMAFYSLGSALGSIAATSLYAAAGWTGVCALGAALSLAALCSWALGERAGGPAEAEEPDLVGPLCHTVGHDQD